MSYLRMEEEGESLLLKCDEVGCRGVARLELYHRPSRYVPAQGALRLWLSNHDHGTARERRWERQPPHLWEKPGIAGSGCLRCGFGPGALVHNSHEVEAYEKWRRERGEGGAGPQGETPAGREAGPDGGGGGAPPGTGLPAGGGPRRLGPWQVDRGQGPAGGGARGLEKRITDFLSLPIDGGDLAAALGVVRAFKGCEGEPEFLGIPFMAWARLEQLEEFLAHRVEGVPLAEDTLRYVED